MSNNSKGDKPSTRKLGLSKLEKVAIPVIVLLAIWGAYSVMQPVSPGAQQTVTFASSPTQSGGAPDPTLEICLTGNTPLVEHIHPNLTIMIEGSQIAIPANIGITSDCTRPAHTHDTSGTIHVESPVNYPFTIQDFFLVWGPPFDSTHILRYTVDSTHTLSMRVNGASNNQFQNYVMQDGDQIVITYGS